MKYGEALNRIVRALRVPQVRASFRLSPTAFALMIQPMSALAQDAAGNASLPRDLTPWGMFMNADEVVKAVAIGLVFASVVTWTVWFAKTAEILLAKRRVQKALNVVASVRSISEGIERGRGQEAP